MGYTIEYKRQFIKSLEGITPCWLAGCNNVYEVAAKGRERREREWTCFHGLVGVKKEDILEAVQPSLGGYDEHWMRGGKWVDDKGLLRWIETGCKSAASIEDILTANPHLSDIHCYVSVWDKSRPHRNELDYYISSTGELDRWIRMYRALHSKLAGTGCSIFPAIDMGSERDFRQPRFSKNPDEEYVLKYQGMYLTGVTENSASWIKDIKQAATFTMDEINEMRKKDWCVRSAQAVKAKSIDHPYNAVIMIATGPHAGNYVYQCTRSRLRLSYTAECARHYPTESAAKKAMAKMQDSYGKQGTFVVKIHTMTDK